MTEHNYTAPTYSLISIVSSIMSWITFIDAQYMLSFSVSIIGIISGIFAIRYYYYAGNEKKQSIQNQK